MEQRMGKVDSPIKICGEFEVTIALNIEMQTKCRVTVVNEDMVQPEKA